MGTTSGEHRFEIGNEDPTLPMERCEVCALPACDSADCARVARERQKGEADFELDHER